MVIFRYLSTDHSGLTFVEAEDQARADAIFEYSTDAGAKSVPVTVVAEVPVRFKAICAEDCTIPILGGYYSLELRELDGWAEVARVKFGPLWSTLYKQAVDTYGEKNVRYNFTPTDGWVAPEGNALDDALAVYHA
jgi:hypothetical protein